MAPHFDHNLLTEHGVPWPNDTPSPASSSKQKKADLGSGDSAEISLLKSMTSKIPETFNVCVHEMIRDRAASQPKAPAICAWDGQLSYAELETASSSFATKLARHQTGPEVYVPIYSEKSVWVPVAMLAVLKAGCAFVLLDPSHPQSRQEEICRTVGARTIVASPKLAEMAGKLVPDVVITGAKDANPSSSTTVVTVHSRNAVYSIFTSGTSGTPKGVTIEHGAFCSSAIAHAKAMNMDAGSRVLQFASYAFDACLTEMLTALIVGACVCIPSDEGRTRDLAGESSRLQPNWALLTPSVTRILNVDDFPTLQTLVLGGEAIHANDVRKWAPHVELFVAYGVSECAVANVARRCTINDVDDDQSNLGFGVGVTCWIVNPDDHERLAAVGEVGELLLDGPSVGRNYIGDAGRTAQAFIDPPRWHRQLRPDVASQHGVKLYKTGDLVSYSNAQDGSIRYVGRKDDQVKFHGQRLEVGEVEHHLRHCLPTVRGLVVDVAKIDGVETLAAFILPELKGPAQNGHARSEGFGLLESSDEFRTRTQLIQRQLSGSIPKWMIPSVFLPLKSMPLLPSGKSDRRQLRSLAASMTRTQLQSYASPSSVAETKRQPTTPMEEAVQRLWADVLLLPTHKIGLDDKFLDLGGDSITAMKLAGAARQRGFNLPVRLVYDNHSLGTMASSMEPISRQNVGSIQPFSLLPDPDDRETFIKGVVEQCQLHDQSAVEDIYPCTPLQEGLISLTVKRPGAYTVAFEYELPTDLDARRFRDACDAAVEANPILRTRIIQIKGSLYQAVIRDFISWESEPAADSITWEDWRLGGPLARLFLHRPTTLGERYRLTFALHHALSDGWAMPLLLRQVQAAYEGSKLVPRPFNTFIYHISQTRPDCDTFWKNRVQDLQAAAFPALPSAAYIPNPTSKQVLEIAVGSCSQYEFNVPNRLKLAWSILISLYTDSSDTLFGVTVSGRGASVLGIEEMTGPTIASIPCRLNIPPNTKVIDALRIVQQDSIETIPFEQAGLQYISRLGPKAAAACRFQSLLVIQPEQSSPPKLFSNQRDLAALNAFSTYAITLICWQSHGLVRIEATFDPDVVETTQLTRVLDQFRHIFEQLDPVNESLLVCDLDTTSARDWSELRQWNQALPKPVHTCAHDLIRQQSDLRPKAPAVCAWDGGFTYGELEELSSSLAVYLMEQGAGPEVFVPLCFEKSRWTTIAMLGVLKAGGAFILLDPSHPAQRLHQICQDAKAPFVISSTRNAEMARSLASHLIVLGLDWKPFEPPKTGVSVPNPSVSPENSIYAVFTSGSTGLPKGAVHSHISWSTSAKANSVGLYLEPKSRVYQFAAYAFDISIADNLLTLVAGGCICVPSNQDLQDGSLMDSINDLGANWACLTPSVARIIDPTKVPRMEKLVLCGEPIASEIITLWSPHAHLLNLYGPAECAILTTLHRNISDPKDPNNVGFATSAVCWVVDAKNEAKLAPIGTVGELLVESPIVGHGYLNNPERTAVSFVSKDQHPAWLTKFRPGGSSRLYRTGDLVQYTKDGSLRYISRKDTQVKLRGQRIELGEVEHHLRRYFPETEEAVAEVITHKGTGRSALTAFILPKPQILKMSDNRFKSLGAEAIAKLELHLPIYMVPTVFIPVNHFPYSKSGKLDRKLLRSMAADISPDEYSMPSGLRRAAPVSSEERTLQELFAQVLRTTTDKIQSSDGHFFRLGGDSILAMNLVAQAKDHGLSFTTPDVFKNPTWSSLAKIVQRYTNGIEHHTEPMSLLHGSIDQGELLNDAMTQCDVERATIEDMYPCTPLQEGLMALAAKTPGMYIGRFKFTIPRDVDLSRFQGAWNAVTAANSILRTRIIQSGKNGIFQAVLKQLPSWEFHDSIEEQECHSEAHVMGLGSPLVHWSLAPIPDRSGDHQFLWTIHHSLYDGWSLPLFWEQVTKAYDGNDLISCPFSRFVRFIDQSQKGEEFWASQLSNIHAAVFPPLPHVDYIPNPNQSFTHSIATPPNYKREHTLSTLIQLSWAVVLSHYTDSEDVVFGVTSNGRGAALDGISEITGPTIATVPVRILLNSDRTVDASLSALQQQTVATIPFLHHGLQNIRKIGADASKACNFQTQLVIQPSDVTADLDLGGLATAENVDFEDYEGFASYAFVMFLHIQEGSEDLEISVNFDPNVLVRDEARRLVEQFHAVLHQLSAKQNDPIGDVEVISIEDRIQLAMWNGHVPLPASEALHDLVIRHSTERPNTQAICAWDGVLTYKELDNLSSRLAGQLLTLGTQPESKIAVCLEKSRWSIVALLAVLRAGCACVLIDPGHPRRRIQESVDKTQPRLIVASKTHENLVQGLSSQVILISEAFVLNLSRLDIQLPTVRPQQAAVVLFTSGSTGTPKGIVMEHVNLSTSILAHAGAMNVRPNSRSLHFASYAFDVSIYEIFNTLVIGGCVCVPSEHDRMNRLADFIRNQEVNWALLTPSTLSLFQPEDVPSLKTLVLAGEAVTRDPVDRWANKVRLINAYGPAEGTFCTVGPIPPSGWRPGTIGQMVGSVGWIVSVSSPSKLAAIGAIGELVIEGEIVTRGYLNEPEKTAAAYIDPPRWLRTFRSGREPGRLYKTGDLVQYNPDGTIRYVGRKDTQIKLRGQRIELGEVEYHVKNCFDRITDVIADVILPSTGGRAPFLAAFVPSDTDECEASGDGDSLFLEPTESFRKLSQKVIAELQATIPPFMVPEVLLPLRRLPLTRSGKVDRRQLRETCSTMSAIQLQSYATEMKAVKRGPLTTTERRLQEIWARVLGMDTESFGVDDNFFRLGGDSINAMQVVAQCAAAGLKTSVAALFHGKTIAQMSLKTEQMNYTAGFAPETLNTRFPLSPAQQMFFDSAGQDFNHFNQNLTFRFSKPVPPAKLKEAVRWIVTNHSMLRARFAQNPDGRWEQFITNDITHSYHCYEHRVLTKEEAKSLINSDQQSLDIQNGPLFLCHLIEVEQDAQIYLSLTAHHLVVDIVSWKILLLDLELIFRGERQPLPPPLSFQTWNRLQTSYVAKYLHPPAALSSLAPKDMFAYWEIGENDNCWGDAVEHGFTLPKQETRALLGRANDAFGTTPVELLHAALLQAFVQTFHDRSAPAIFSESHGREPWDAAIDLTRTVGWFTTMWPAEVSVAPTDTLLEIVRRTKDTRRQVNKNGWEHFTSRYLHPQGAARSHSEGPLEILFNYDPGFTEEPKAILHPFSLLDGELHQMSPKMTRFALIDVLAEVKGSQLSFRFIFNRHLQHRGVSIRQWIDNTKRCLQSATYLLTQQNRTYTISDFPLLQYSYSEIDEFNKTVVATLKSSSLEIEDAYPCSPIQEGMMLSQAKVVGQYVNRWFWTVKSANGSPVQPIQLKNAWDQVLKKHPLLLTVLYERPNRSGHHNQLVLKEPPPEMCVVLETSDDPLKVLEAHEFEIPPLSPPHRLAVCISQSGDVACLLEINHTVVDGISRQLFLRDLLLAYNGKLSLDRPQAYREYIQYLEKLPNTQAIMYWEKYLASVEPCILPASPPRGLSAHLKDTKRFLNLTIPFNDSLRDFCAQHELTMANTFQLAWALVLRLYLNADSACFGYMTSGRDVPIPDIDNTVGPFINLLICHILFDGNQSVLSILQKNQTEFVESLVHQHLSMAEKMKATKSSETALFNTVMSVQKEIQDNPNDSTIRFENFNGDDPTEVSTLFSTARSIRVTVYY
jgi:amino acid adenylation domain-containing protein